MALKAAGAPLVSAFVAHAVFPKDSWQRFCRRPRAAAAAAAEAAAAEVPPSSPVASAAPAGTIAETAVGDRAIFERFWVTNSIPGTAARLPAGDVFVVLDIMPKLAADLP